MDEYLKRLEIFRKARKWDIQDTASNLSKSIIIEAAELLEHFQWSEDSFNLEEVEAELADVLMYSLALCLHLKLNPIEIMDKKMLDVAKRYPALKEIKE